MADMTSRSSTWSRAAAFTCTRCSLLLLLTAVAAALAAVVIIWPLFGATVAGGTFLRPTSALPPPMLILSAVWPKAAAAAAPARKPFSDSDTSPSPCFASFPCWVFQFESSVQLIRGWQWVLFVFLLHWLLICSRQQLLLTQTKRSKLILKRFN